MKDSFPEKIKKAVKKEGFARLLDIKPVEVSTGYAKVKMKVGEEHLNLLNIAHGGVVFTVLDEAFELASNSHGTIAMALSITINYLRPVQAGETIIAEATEVARTRRTGNYRFLVTNQDGELVAHGQGVVYRKDQELEI